MTSRPDHETLLLLRDVVEEVGTNSAIQAGGTLFELRIDVAPTPGFSAVEPPTPVLRHLLDRLRHLDMQSSDVRLERVFPILDRVGVKLEWQGYLQTAKDAYQDAQEVTNIRVQDPDEPPTNAPTWIRPREAFGLWAYGGVIHHEYAKEQRWKRLGPLAQGPVRDMAHAYTMMLIDQAEFMTRLLRYGLASDLSPEALVDQRGGKAPHP